VGYERQESASSGGHSEDIGFFGQSIGKFQKRSEAPSPCLCVSLAPLLFAGMKCITGLQMKEQKEGQNFPCGLTVTSLINTARERRSSPVSC
jgi:hypothetical protein